MIHLAPSLLLALASSGDHAALHPADANLYVHLPDVSAALVAYQQAPLVRLATDDEIGALVRGLLGLPDEFDLVEGALVPLSGFLGMLGEGFTEGFAEELCGLAAQVRSTSCSIVGLAGAASTALAAEVRVDPTALLRRLELLMVVELEGASAAERLLAIAGETLEPAATGTGPGSLELLGSEREIHRFIFPGGLEAPPIWMLSADRLLVVGLGAASPEALAARVASGRSLLTRAEEPGAAEHFTTPTGATLYEASWWLPTAPFYADLLRSAGPEVGLDLASTLLGSWLPLEAMVSRSRMQLREGRFVKETIERRPATAGEVPGNGSSEDRRPTLGPAPLDPAVLGRVSPQALGVWAMTLSRERSRSLASRLVEAVLQQDPADIGAEAAEAAERMGPILDQILGSIGEDVALYLLPIAGLKVPLHAVLALHDAAAFERGVTDLAHLLEELAQGALSVDTRPYRRQPVVSLKPDLTSLGVPPMVSIDLTLGIVGDRAILGLNAMDVKKEMRRLLSDETGAHPLTQDGALPKGATSISWVDWGALVGGIYDSARALASLLPDTGMLPIDVASLPESKLFTRHFRPSKTWSRRVEQGTYSFSESSFGPELLLGGIAAGGAFGLMQAMDSPQVEFSFTQELTLDDHPTSQPDPGLATRQALQEVKLGLVLFRSERGELPERLEALLEASEAFPRGYLRRDTLQRDGWGNALRYERTGGGQGFALWSVGPNGEDERGAGDDIAAP